MAKASDKAQRAARARALRARIEQVKSQPGTGDSGAADVDVPADESPHQFVERRMREIAAQERRAATTRRVPAAPRPRRTGKAAPASARKKR